MRPQGTRYSPKTDLGHRIALGLRPLVGLVPFVLLAWFTPGGVRSDILLSSALSFFVWTLGQNVAISASMFVYSALQDGGLEQLLTLPVSRGGLLLGYGLGSFARELAGTMLGLGVVCLASAGLGLRVTIVSWLGAVTAIALLLLAMWGLGVILGGVTLLSRRMDYTFMAVSLVALLAGPVYSPAVYPSWLKALSLVSPMTFPLDLFRHSSLGIPLLTGVGLELAGSLLWAVMLLVMGMRVFGWATARTRRMGSAGLH